jgi:hypothetical protein
MAVSRKPKDPQPGTGGPIPSQANSREATRKNAPVEPDLIPDELDEEEMDDMADEFVGSRSDR